MRWIQESRFTPFRIQTGKSTKLPQVLVLTQLDADRLDERFILKCTQSGTRQVHTMSGQICLFRIFIAVILCQVNSLCHQPLIQNTARKGSSTKSSHHQNQSYLMAMLQWPKHAGFVFRFTAFWSVSLDYGMQP